MTMFFNFLLVDFRETPFLGACGVDVLPELEGCNNPLDRSDTDCCRIGDPILVYSGIIVLNDQPSNGFWR